MLDESEMNLPEPLDFMALLAQGRDETLDSLWRFRIAQHHRDTYAGIPMSKFPEDLRTYETILWERAPSVVVEVGVQYGGSTLWLRDRLFDFQRYRGGPVPKVIAVDIDLGGIRGSLDQLLPEASAGLALIEGDIRDPGIVAQVIAQVPERAEVFVIEDAQHDAETTQAALDELAPLISGGGYYMVEDTCVDVEALRANPDWPRGCGLALDRWLTSDPLGRRFRRRPDLQPYGLTCHPGGLLQRLTDV